MKKAFIMLSVLMSNYFCAAQSDFDVNTTLENIFNGKFINQKKYADIDGSPYFPNQWIGGTVTLKAGKIIPMSALRYNTVTGNLEYESNQQPYDVINSISEFTLGNIIFKNGFQQIGDNNNETLYQVLYDGKHKLLCKHESSIRVEQPYNSASKVRTFVHKETYFISKNDGKMYEVKKNLKNILVAFYDQTSQIEQYCKKEALKLRSWNDAVKVLEYADSLEKQ